MSISFFRGLELVVGALLPVAVVVGVVLVWMWFLGLGKAASSAELAPDVSKIEGGYVTNVGGGVRVFLWICNLGGGLCCRVRCMYTTATLCVLLVVFLGLWGRGVWSI